MKPYAESCDQNRDCILEVIAPLLADKNSLLEIGSGTGQHAVFFAERLPQLIWQTSDRDENHAGIQQWLDDAGLDNVKQPLSIDVNQADWHSSSYDVIFSANAIHIMSWGSVLNMFTGIGKVLSAGGLLILYGPFNYQGAYTSESNQSFDGWLKDRDPESGIRDFEAIEKLAYQHGMSLYKDLEMPANNRILCWQMDD